MPNGLNDFTSKIALSRFAPLPRTVYLVKMLNSNRQMKTLTLKSMRVKQWSLVLSQSRQIKALTVLLKITNWLSCPEALSCYNRDYLYKGVPI